jgi:putative membrane protein
VDEQKTPARVDTSAASPIDRASFELSSRRTGMSFQRTRMSADRTLMSVIRTSLSLISFGFTIYQFFQKLMATNAVSGQLAAGRFGQALVYLGVGMLILGIIYHLQFMHGIRKVREEMTGEGYIHGQSHFPISLTLVTAVVLLLIGLAAIVSIVFDMGPFG